MGKTHKKSPRNSYSDPFFQLAFDESVIAKALLSLDGRILKANRAACEWLGYSEAELLAMTFSDVSHPDDIAPTLNILQPVLEGEKPSARIEKRYVRKDGKVIWGLVNTMMIRAADGSPLYRLSEVQDITERKQTEESLRRSEAKFRAIIENSHDGVAFIDANATVLYRSPRYDRINGYTSEERVGKSGFDTVHPEDQPQIRQLLGQVVENPGVPFKVEYRTRHKAGHWIWIESTAQNLLDNPDVQAIVINTRDITERKQADQALRRSEAKFRAVVENSNDGIVMIDANNVVIYRSASTSRINAITNQERLGRDVLEVVHPDDQARLRQFLEQVRQIPGVPMKIEFCGRHAGGHWLWMEAKVQNLLDNPDIQAVVISVRDITERKQTTESLRRSEAKFRAVMENIKEGIIFYNAAGIIVYQSPSCTALHGYSPEERLGRGFDLPHPDDLPRIRQLWREILQTPDASLQVEFRTHHKNGEWRWAECNVYNFLENPDIQAVVTSNRDITARKQVEEALRSSEQAAHRLNDQLSMVNEMMLNLTSGLEIELLMQKLHEQCLRIGPIDTFYVFLYDEKTGILSSLYNFKDGKRLNLPPRSIRENPGLTGYIIQHPQTIYIPDSMERPEGIPQGIRQPGKISRSVVVVPLFSRETIIGVLSMQNSQPNVYTPEQVQSLELFAPQVAIAIQNSQLYEQQQSERNLANALIDNLPGGFILMDRARRIRRWNKFIEMVFGYSPQELAGMDVLALIVPEDRTLVAAEIDRVFTTSTRIAEARLISRDGSKQIPFYITGTRVEINGESYLAALGVDISARKQAEEENRRRVQELEAIAQITTALRQAQNRADMIQVLLEESMRILDAQGGAIGLLNGSTLSIQGSAGLIESLRGQNILQNDGLCWQVIHSGETRLYDGQTGPGTPVFVSMLDEATSSLRSGILTPLKSGDLRNSYSATIGVFFWGFTSPQPVPADQRGLAITLAEMAGVTLHRISMSEALEKIVADRSRELQTIYRVAASANPGLELGAILQNALEVILPAVNAASGAVLLWDDRRAYFELLASKNIPGPGLEYLDRLDKNSIEGWVLENGQPLVLADASVDARSPFKHTIPMPFAALPMRTGKQPVGVLDVSRMGGEAFNLEELTLLDFVADHLGLVVGNALLFRQVEDHAVVEERSRMARALHDSVTQLLYSAMLYAEGSARQAENENWQAVRANLGELSLITRQALQEMRLMVYELRTPALHQDGLVQALQHRLDAVETRSGIQAAMLADPLPRLPERVEESLYRIALEALNNSLKHARAKNVTVFIRRSRRELLLCVRDDGAGFDVDSGISAGGLGLASMKERVEHLGGRLAIRSTPGSGCEVEAVIPLSGAKNLRKNSK